MLVIPHIEDFNNTLLSFELQDPLTEMVVLGKMGSKMGKLLYIMVSFLQRYVIKALDFRNPSNLKS